MRVQIVKSASNSSGPICAFWVVFECIKMSFFKSTAR